MSEQSPPPTAPEGPLSPDGLYRWDGSQWQPVPAPIPGRTRSRTSTIARVIFVIGAIFTLVGYAIMAVSK